MRLRIKELGKDSPNNCRICMSCMSKKNLLGFYDLYDDTLHFCLCKDCIKAIYIACADSCMFGNPKTESSDADYQYFKAGYREGYRDGFRDNYELHD